MEVLKHLPSNLFAGLKHFKAFSGDALDKRKILKCLKFNAKGQKMERERNMWKESYSVNSYEGTKYVSHPLKKCVFFST